MQSQQPRQSRHLGDPRTSRRLAALATALIACGSLAALPGAPPAQGVSTLSGPAASTAVTTVRAPWVQDPLAPERMGSAPGPTEAAPWLSSSTSLVTSLSPSSPLINGTGTAGPALTDRPAGPRHPRGRYQWPTGAPATVVEDFDPPAVVWGRGHRGVDLAAAEGTQIRSAAAGRVAFAGMVAGRPVVSIDHADGIRTTYEPVEPAVSAGDTVAAGQVIGTLLPGHRSDGVCALHWGARTGPKTYINPLRLLQPAVIRLKPLH